MHVSKQDVVQVTIDKDCFGYYLKRHARISNLDVSSVLTCTVALQL